MNKLAKELRSVKKQRTIKKTKSQIDDDNLLNPMQKLAWDNYMNPKSPTFANARKSALSAGFAPTYARVVTTREWWKMRSLKMNLLGKSEKVLDKVLSIVDTVDDKGQERADLLRVQVDAAKHVTKTLGKDEGWSERTELTGNDGQPIVFLPSALLEKYGLNEEDK